jgi:hypothetical protein
MKRKKEDLEAVETAKKMIFGNKPVDIIWDEKGDVVIKKKKGKKK